MDKDLLRYYCSRHGMTLDDLAKRLDMSETTLYRKLRGDSDFYRGEIIEIKEILDLDPSAVNCIFFNRNLA